MSKILVIPDVHLKPWMFEKADKLASEGNYDGIVILGDLIDDWAQGMNLDLYNETFDAAIAFIKKHKNTYYCYGNHDVSYLWEFKESGYSEYARDIVVDRMQELKNELSPEKCAFIHKINNTLFSHAGLTSNFVCEHFGGWLEHGQSADDIEYMVEQINNMSKFDLWKPNSPIWDRPQFAYSGGMIRLYPMYQVVGHTPVEGPLEENMLLTLDTFSTYRTGGAIGDEKFVWVDTVAKTWQYAECTNSHYSEQIKSSCPKCGNKPRNIEYRNCGPIVRIRCPKCGFFCDEYDGLEQGYKDIFEYWNNQDSES